MKQKFSRHYGDPFCQHDNVATECPICNKEEQPLENSDPYEVVAVFTSQFSGTCTINREHRIKRGDKVGRVQYSDNPFIAISGVCCEACVNWYPRAKS